MSIDEDLFKKAELKAANKYKTRVEDLTNRLHYLNRIDRADRLTIIEETSSIIEMLKKENKYFFLEKEYLSLYDTSGIDATKKYLDSKSKLNPLTWIDTRFRVAKKYLKKYNK